jgi:tRNA G46 methylase TrmB
VLLKAVEKACRSIDVYLDRKPISKHTQHAFDVLMSELAMATSIPMTTTMSNPLDRTDTENDCGGNMEVDIDIVVVQCTNEKKNHILQSVPIILDSGCGTGRSTKILARTHPNHLVIGVDRSFVRLTKEKANRQGSDRVEKRRGGSGSSNTNNDDDVEDSDEDLDDDVTLDIDDDENDDGRMESSLSSLSSSSSSSSKRPFCLQVAPNAYLVRAELVDFWRCCLQDELWQSAIITHHYLLYPNPYPTNARLTQRWYAHPSFPLLFRLDAGTIIVRSNWENYLTEFATSVQLANDYYTSQQPPPQQQQQDQPIIGDDRKGEESPITSTASWDRKSNNQASLYFKSAKVGPHKRTDKTLPLTNFEAKYDNVGEPTYELILSRESLI